MYSKADKRKYLILQCRYYKGEAQAPEQMKDNLFWGYERYWVELALEDGQDLELLKEEAQAFNLESKSGDTTPLTLKALLWNRYFHNTCGLVSEEEELKSFELWYAGNYLNCKTNREQRADQRRPELITKCRYFHGEQTNPWEFCYSSVLVYRRDIWSIEKEWVDAMAYSYNCPQSSKQLIRDFALEEFFKSKGIALSLVNLILCKEKATEEQKRVSFGPAEAIKAIEKYEKLAPLGHDYKKYFAFYLGEKECPYGFDDAEEYMQMGWSQEKLQKEHCRSMCDFDSKDFQKRYRGKEGIWGWYADPKFPREQKDILYFTICNWGRWCPYCDEDKLAEEYLNYHYPGDKKPKHSDRFYHNAALQEIKEEEYYKTVRKCGIYQGKRAYQPIFKDEYILEPPKIGLPLVILVDDDGNAESIRDFLFFNIYDEIREATKLAKKKTNSEQHS